MPLNPGGFARHHVDVSNVAQLANQFGRDNPANCQSQIWLPINSQFVFSLSNIQCNDFNSVSNSSVGFESSEMYQQIYIFGQLSNF